MFATKFLVSLLLLHALNVQAASLLEGRVVSVSDGDTVTVLDSASVQHRIRLSGIDAPEKNQPFGQKAKESLAGMIYGKQIRAECVKNDQYGREICKIIANGVDVNLAQVRAGMAWWYRHYANEQAAADRPLYEQAEMVAKGGRIGLWADVAPTPPWAWRRQ